MLSLILSAVLTISCLYFFIARFKKYQELDKLPGPSLSEIIKYSTYRRTEMFTYLENLNNRYGAVVKLWIKPFQPTLVVAHPKYVENVLLSRQHISKPDIVKITYPLGGDSLFGATDDDLWKRERKMFGYACTQQAIRKDMHVYKRHFDKLEHILRKQITSATVDFYPLFDSYVMDILFDFLMDEQLNMQDTENVKFVHDFGTAIDILMHKILSVVDGNDFLFKFSKYYNQWTQTLQDLYNFTDNIISRKLEDREKMTGNNEREYLKQLLGNGIKQERMKFHINTFIAGGHETTSHMLSFALFEVAKQPSVQKKILDELLATIGNDKHVDLTFEDMQHLVYTECVLKETLRLYPALPILQRLIKTPVTVDGTTIPSGTTILFSVGALHRNEKYFPRPNIFDPDRFMEELPPNVYIPFSAGSRNCIGDRIAMSIMKYTLAKLIRNFELLPEPGAELDIVNRGIVVHSTTGAVVRIKERQL